MFARVRPRHYQQHEAEFNDSTKTWRAKNLIAFCISLAAIVAAFIYTPLALVLIATPAVRYFPPEHGIAFFVNGRKS